MVVSAVLSELAALRAAGVKRVVFSKGELSEVEFFEAVSSALEGETVELELPEDDGIPMGVRNAANVLMAKKREGRSA